MCIYIYILFYIIQYYPILVNILSNIIEYYPIYYQILANIPYYSIISKNMPRQFFQATRLTRMGT